MSRTLESEPTSTKSIALDESAPSQTKRDESIAQAAGARQAESDLALGGDPEWGHYTEIVKKAGGVVPLPGSKATVLGIRSSNAVSSKYLDTFVVLHGDKRVLALRGSTVPSAKKKGVGELVPGNYVTSARVTPKGEIAPYLDGPAFRIKEAGGKDPQAFRDADGDGAFSDAEQQKPLPMTGELFHQGGESNPISEGCMTMAPSVYALFLQAVGGAHASFNFTLVSG